MAKARVRRQYTCIEQCPGVVGAINDQQPVGVGLHPAEHSGNEHVGRCSDVKLKLCEWWSALEDQRGGGCSERVGMCTARSSNACCTSLMLVPALIQKTPFVYSPWWRAM